jgi:hypothetical protein
VSIGSSAAVFLSSLVGGTSPTEPVNLRPILTQLGREASVHLRAQLSRPCNGKKKNHSLPGEYPKSETGNLRSSVGFKVSGKDKVFIGYKHQGNRSMGLKKGKKARSTSYADKLQEKGRLGPIDALNDIKSTVEQKFNIRLRFTPSIKWVPN